METYEYAYKLTNRDRAAEISKEDSLASVFPDKVKVHKYTFAVCNTPKSITETAYRGYLSEEEFVTLLSMILKDAERSASLKHSADPKTEELKALIAKKLKEISQKSAK